MHGGSLAWLTVTPEHSHHVCYNCAFFCCYDQSKCPSWNRTIRLLVQYFSWLFLWRSKCMLMFPFRRFTGKYQATPLSLDLARTSNYNFSSGYKQFISQVLVPPLYKLLSVPMKHYRTIVGNGMSSIVYSLKHSLILVVFVPPLVWGFSYFLRTDDYHKKLGSSKVSNILMEMCVLLSCGSVQPDMYKHAQSEW